MRGRIEAAKATLERRPATSSLASSRRKRSRIHRFERRNLRTSRSYNSFLEKTSFYHIVDYLHVEIVEVKEDDVCWERCCSTLYNSQASQVVCDIVKHTYAFLSDARSPVTGIFVLELFALFLTSSSSRMPSLLDWT